jgi:pimeloyl-ACP methyl ester carboxylesterase
MTLPQTQLLDELVGRIRINFTPERVLKAEQIADRLHEQTSEVSDFDLLPALGRLDIPTLVITAEHDFIPVDIATEIADAIPRSRLVVFDGCGHFSYMERPDDVFESVTAFIGQSTD